MKNIMRKPTIFSIFFYQFHANPRQLAHHLKKLKKYLDKSTSEPGKVQFQMIEGEKVINEAIKYLKTLPPIPPLEWEDALTLSAQHHVNDIAQKEFYLTKVQMELNQKIE